MTTSSLADALTLVELDRSAAAFYDERSRRALALFESWADAYKLVDPSWQTSGSDEAQLARRIEEQRRHVRDNRGDDLLEAKEVAARLGITKPDGTPRDSFYSSVAPRIGIRVGKTWRFPPEKVDAFLKGELE